MEKVDENTQVFSDRMDTIIAGQREFFRSGKTRSFEFRRRQLQNLKTIIEENEDKINNAIKKDLGRSDFVLTFTTGGVITEIKYALERVLQFKPPFVSHRLKHWMRPKKTRSPLLFLGNKTYIEKVPKGVVLVIGPWNYPFLLMLSPLVGAIAAGNCAVIKPSEVSPNTSKVIAELINENFDQEFLHVVEGGVEESTILTNKKEWDHIFFTGGTEIGRIIYQAAAKNLIPVTLELGGKTPTIIDKDIDLKLTAKRITQMKFLNVGQTCMAPDYLFVHNDVKSQLIAEMKRNLTKFYGDKAIKSNDYARIINDRHFDRLIKLTNNGGKVLSGGDNNPSEKYIGPTILDDVTVNSEIMQEEIFGPILPIISWNDPKEIVDYIESQPHPLALYIYTKNKKFKEHILQNTTFGGGMINDSVMYYLHPEAPFGGVGDSGIGKYSGKYSFDELSQTRPIVEAGGFMDRMIEKTGGKFFRYPPYNGFKIKLLKLFQRTFSRFRM
jgi:acyl-CoA reductase-like NAD-dependent aldehyde dehydrogenase